MKILCVIDSIGSGGAQRQLVELARSFKEMGYEVSFLTYHHATFYLETLHNLGIAYTCIEEQNYLKRLLKMRSFIRKGRFDGVLSFLEASNFICEMAGFPLRHWSLVVGERSANPNILQSKKLRFYRWMHLFADRVIANSHENIRMVRQINPLLSDKKCKVVYNMIDLDKWSPSSDYVPLKDNKLKIVVAASHQKVKNLIGLVEAVGHLSKADQQRLVIEWYGDHGFDDSFNQAKEMIDNYSITHVFNFFPATLEITKKMQQADAIALFSHHEGLPNAICEGMAVGKAIIATRVSDLPILLSDQNGVLCDSKDYNSIADAIRRVLAFTVEDLELMGRNSRNLAKSLFEREVIIEEYNKALVTSKIK